MELIHLFSLKYVSIVKTIPSNLEKHDKIVLIQKNLLIEVKHYKKSFYRITK